MCPAVLHLLYMYTNQSLCVNWNSNFSKEFCVSNCVKQGAILSPTLFNVYIDGLLVKLRDSGIGCHIGCNYFRALAYADDLVLLCPSRTGASKMLHLCHDYATEHGHIFNVSKSDVILLNNSNEANDPHFVIDNNVLPVISSLKHLGLMIYRNVKGLVDIEFIVKQFQRSVNILLADLGSVSSNVHMKLFFQYCSNLYGVSLISMLSHSSC